LTVLDQYRPLPDISASATPDLAPKPADAATLNRNVQIQNTYAIIAQPVLRPEYIRKHKSGLWPRIGVEMLARHLACTLIVVGLASGTLPSYGQQSDQGDHQTAGLEEVVVTARRVEENIQRVPISVSVVPKEILEQKPYFDVEDFSRMAVGLTAVAAINSRDEAFFNIRGQMFGVVNYFNEVPITNPTPTAIGDQNGSYSGMALDSASVQVLRGPQGTLFGRNATGGAVLFESARPSNEFEAYAQAGTGNYSLQSYEAMLNVPIVSDKLALRVVGDATYRDGFTTNIFSGKKMDDINSWNLRGSLLFTPIEGLENRLVAQVDRSHDNGSANQLDFVPTASVFTALAPALGLNLQQLIAQNLANGPRIVNISVPTGQYLHHLNDQTFISNTTSYSFSSAFTLKNIFGYYESESISDQNFSGTLIPFFSGLVAPGIPASRRNQYSDELQLRFKFFDGRLDGVIGNFYGLNHQNSGTTLNCTAFFTPTASCTSQSDAISPQDKQTSEAVFTQETLDLSDWVLKGLKVTAGYRQTQDKVSSGATSLYSGGPGFSLVQAACNPGTVGPNCISYTPLSAGFNVGTYNFDIDYQITSEIMAYVTTRHGYRPGGFNSAQAQTTPFRTFKPEKVTDYEAGLKSEFKVGEVPFRVNVAVYTGNYSDVQQNTTVDLSVYNGLPPNTQLGNVTQNAAKATVRGVELEALAKPLTGLTLSARANYIDAKYKDFTIIIQQPGIPLQPYDASGQSFPNTPAHTYGFTADYEFPVPDRIGIVSVHGDWYWQSHTQGAEGGTLFEPWAAIDAWSATNFGINWRKIMHSALDASVFINNAFDQVHVIDVEAPAVIAYRSAVFDEPRTYGIRFRYSFGKLAP
jgi:iron complex outermembrane receptor protein